MSMRNWSVAAIDPEPIDLKVKIGNQGRLVYSVDVTGLDLVKQ